MSQAAPTIVRSANAEPARFDEAGFLPLPKLLPLPIREYLKVYFRILMMNGRMRPDELAPLSPGVGGDPALDAFLDLLGPQIGRRIGRDLVPTTSYARIYMQGDVLPHHTDRDSCEFAVSICVATPPGAQPQRLHFRRPGGRTGSLSMREGDACVYLGAAVEHWRDPFPESGHIQLFLCYIDRAGPHFPALRFDGRPRLGARKAGQGPREKDS